MHSTGSFYYQDNGLYFGEYKLSDFVTSEQPSTYVYNANIILNRFKGYENLTQDISRTVVCDAKEYHISVLSLMNELGTKFICNNQGQISKLIQSASIDPANIIFFWSIRKNSRYHCLRN